MNKGGEMQIYLVTWDNHGDIDEREPVMVTEDLELALKTAQERGNSYTVSVIEKWSDNVFIDCWEIR